jgi:eukaryotic-like serine/threonine-protein kinase
MTLPARLGRYEVQDLLARGGMGAVYKARDPSLDRIVAVKTVQAVLLGTDQRDEFLARFQREARAAGRLAHPHIVSVHDFGLDEPTATPFIVMEYVAGVSLEALLKENPRLPVAQALEIVEQVASALEEAHAHGIVHRDIKPANVFLDERGRVKVGDFGIARLDGSDLTEAGVTLGTPGYAAPEIVRGGVADARSDVFALGALAYRLLTGEKPFRGTTRETIAMDVLQWDPPPAASVRPDVPPHVSAAVMKALAKEPGDRTPGVAAFLRDIRGAAAALAPTTPVVPPTVPASAVQTAGPPTATVASVPQAPRNRRAALIVAVVALAVAAGLGALWLLRNGSGPEPHAGGTPKATRPAGVGPVTAPASPRAAARPANPPRATAAPAASGVDEVKDVLEKVLEEAQKAGQAPPPGGGAKGRGKGHGKGKKH